MPRKFPKLGRLYARKERKLEEKEEQAQLARALGKPDTRPPLREEDDGV